MLVLNRKDKKKRQETEKRRNKNEHKSKDMAQSNTPEAGSPDSLGRSEKSSLPDREANDSVIESPRFPRFHSWHLEPDP